MRVIRTVVLLLVLSSVLAACQNSSIAVEEVEVQAADVRLHVRMAGNPDSWCVLVAINGGPGLTSSYLARGAKSHAFRAGSVVHRRSAGRALQPDGSRGFRNGHSGHGRAPAGWQAGVTKIAEGSPADLAGLHPGFVIAAANGWTLEEIVATGLQMPPDNERNRRANQVNGLRSMLFGEPGQEAAIEYLDADDGLQRTTLQFAPRSSNACGRYDPSLPPACAEFEMKRLADRTGYLRFSAFLTPVLDSVLQAIDDLHDAPALTYLLDFPVKLPYN